MKETFDYGNDLIAAKEVNTKIKKPKIMVDNNNWIFYKEEYFTTAVKAATWIKKEN